MAHDHGPANYHCVFAIGVLLNVTYVVIEATYGLLAHSLALVADAGHNLSDVLGLLLAWGGGDPRAPCAHGAAHLRPRSLLDPRRARQRRPPAHRHRRDCVGGGAALRGAGAVAGRTVIVVAAIGITINTATALLFLSGRKGDLNIRGAFLHMAADAGVSVGVVVAGFLILLTGWQWLDPAISLGIVAVILVGTWGLLRDSVNLALDAVPEGIDVEAVRAYLASLPGVTEVHDLHIWGMSTTETALTAHLVVSDVETSDALIAQGRDGLHDRFEIAHATFQIETTDAAYPCPLAPANVV